ncbi:ankyrin repeat domain-containing protein [Aspergillus fijiensis CBS 313.89]|uniref:Ankyrin n=1 Tax=Aspergillus fijiensis CBS 313.89 TaxID=1448319 RepID=A0A8G1RQK0_9EURO|nr:ankyrin [Aspergillus fijiensis CBS 313.89]RAK77469.1 ankyrin [Aspergillus fijiensis CBS 313.89]
MSLSTLTNELLLQVESYIETQTDLAALLQGRRVYKLLVPCLYRRDATAALLYGVQNDLYSTACKALQAGADRNVRSRDKRRPMISLAAENGSLEMARLLLGASSPSPSPSPPPPPVDLNMIDKNRYTALLLAAAVGHAAMIELLLAHRADPNKREKADRTALFMAAIRGHTAAVRTLLAYHDDPQQPELELDVIIKHGGETALLAAVGRTTLRSGPQPVLHSAVLHRQPELLQLVVNRDEIDLNRIYQDETALGLAVERNDDDLAAILLADPRVHPDLTLNGGGETPLMRAILKNNERMTQLLRDAGANPRIMNRWWVSPATLLEAPSWEARRELIEKYLGSEVRLAPDCTLG